MTLNTNKPVSSVTYNGDRVGLVSASFKDIIERTNPNPILPYGLTKIGSSAFEFDQTIVMPSIPDSVTSIGEWAFGTCTNLALTSLPADLVELGQGAFYGCTGLTSIKFNGVPEYIAEDAFDGCTNLTDITVPWYEGDVANAPWGATNATIHYKTD